MAYNIPYDTDYSEWYGTPQNVTRLYATLEQVENEYGEPVGRITASWDIPDNGGTFVALVSTDGETYTIEETGITKNSVILSVEPSTSYYLKIVTVLGISHSDGTISDLLDADETPVPSAPVITVRESGLIIDVGIIPQDYVARILIDDGESITEIETSQPTYTYLCDPGDYEISVAFEDVSGNVSEYTEPISVTVEEVYVRKDSPDYIKRAEVNGNSLMLTTGDNRVIIFQGGGGGGGFSPITQDGDTITIPSGVMDGTVKQEMLTMLMYPTRMLVLSDTGGV